MFLNGKLLDLVHYSFENGATEFGVGNFASSEKEANFNLVTLVEELLDPSEFDLKIVLTDLKSEADLLYFNLLLSLAALGELFALLVAVFAPIEDFNYGRFGIRSYFRQIQTCFCGQVECLPEAYDSALSTINIYQTHCLGGNFTVQTDFVDLEVSLKSSRVLYQLEGKWSTGIELVLDGMG